jgi:hypothetical protein
VLEHGREYRYAVRGFVQIVVAQPDISRRQWMPVDAQRFQRHESDDDALPSRSVSHR